MSVTVQRGGNRTPLRAGRGGDMGVAAICGGLLGGLIVLWLARGLAVLLSHGHWPSGSPASVARRLPELVRGPGDLSRRLGLPAAESVGRAAFATAVLLVVLPAVVGAVLVVRQLRLRRGAPGWATRKDIDQHMSLAAVRRKNEIIRPSLTDTKAPPGQVGVHLGRDVHTRREIYGSFEDSYLILGPPRSGKGQHLVIPITLDTPGAVVVPSTKPDTLRATIDARSKRGPVHVFDPQGLADWSEQLRWAPERGCEHPLTAILRAKAFTSGSRAGVGVENGDFWSGMTQAVIRCYLHAAALDGRPISEVLRWAGAPADPEPVRVLRRASGAADGWSEELAEQVGADARQRGSVWAGVRRAFDSLADPRVLAACSPGPDAEAYDARRFIEECGTLYLLGSSGAQLSVAPLVTAMIEDIVESGRRLAAASPHGRLDPPLVLMLDEVANIAPLPSLPSLLSDGGGVGIPTVAVFQSLGQARSRWGHEVSDAMWDASTIKLIFGGLSRPADLEDISRLFGTTAKPRRTISKTRDGTSQAVSTDQAPVLSANDLRTITAGSHIVLHRNTQPVRCTG